VSNAGAIEARRKTPAPRRSPRKSV